MKLVMTLLVRDEADILEHNLAFHRSVGIDHFIVMDNRSVDATPAIVQRYVAAGLAELLHQPADDYAQAEWVTAMARRAAIEQGADWVINNDADEFWLPSSGDLKATLAAVGLGFGAVRAPRHNFVPLTPEPAPDCPFYEAMVWREVVSRNALGRPLPPKVAHRGSPTVEVAQGNHAVRGVLPAAVAEGGLEILHFPLRRRAQFENKIRLGGAAYARNTRLPPGVGSTWRRLHEQQQAAGDLEAFFAEQLYDAARLERALAAGELVEDPRLRDRLRRLTTPS